MSARVEVARTLPVSVYEGYDFISSPENWPLYWPGLLELRETSAWSAPGDRIRMVQLLLGRPVELTLILEERRPYERVVFRSEQVGLPDARHERGYDAAGDDMLYTMAVEWETRGGPVGWADRMLIPRNVRRALEESADTLERLFAGRRG